MIRSRIWLAAALWVLVSGCLGMASGMPDSGGSTEPEFDAGQTVDSGSPPDAGERHDAGSIDSGQPDSGEPDAGPLETDAGSIDAGHGIPTVVVVGYGARRASSTDGLTWNNFQQITPNGGDDDNLFRGVGFGGGVFVAVGGSSKGFSMTSTDGVTWDHENRNASAWIGNVAWLGSYFVAAGGNGLRMRSLDLGQTWVDEAGYQGIHYRDVTAIDGVAVAVGHTYGGTGIITSTTDGVTWTERKNDGTSFNHAASGNHVFVATGDSGRLSWSADGAAWTDVDLGTTQGGNLIFTGTDFVASFGSSVFRSTDGQHWNSATSARGVDGYFAGQYFNLGWPATIAVSTNLSAWTTVFNPQGSGLTKFVTGEVAP